MCWSFSWWTLRMLVPASDARYGGDCSDVRHQLVRVRQIQATGSGGSWVAGGRIATWVGTLNAPQHRIGTTGTTFSRWWFQSFFYFHPYLGKMNPFWRAYFFRCVEKNHQPEERHELRFCWRHHFGLKKPIKKSPPENSDFTFFSMIHLSVWNTYTWMSQEVRING